MKNDTISKPSCLSVLPAIRPQSGPSKGKPEHVAGMDRNSGAMPVLDHAPVFTQHPRAGLFDHHAMITVVGVLILGGIIQIVRIERFDPDKGLIASGFGRQIDEAAAARMLGAGLFALRHIGIARGVHIDLHHERELGESLRICAIPVRISSHRGLRKKSSSTRNNESNPVVEHRVAHPCKTDCGSRERIVRPITFFTEQ